MIRALARGIPRDTIFAARRLWASPGFTAAAVLTIALGVGLNTGVFSLLNGIFLSGLPVPAGSELVDMYETVSGLDGRNEKGRTNTRFTTHEFRTFRDESTTLSGLLAYSVAGPIVLGDETTRRITGRYVSCNYFDVLRQPPALGRALTAADCAAGAEPVVVLGYDFWQRAYASDSAIVGRTVRLNGRPITVAGIAAKDAYQPELEKLDLFAPISVQPVLRPDRDWLADEAFGWLTLIGRLAPGSTLDAARAELGGLAAGLDAGRPGRATTMHLDPASVTTNRPIPRVSLSLNVVTILIPFCLALLVACANVANLFLARASGRSAEIALRRSLGASRRRVARELLLEVLLVALAGGALGCLLALRTVEALTAFALTSLPIAVPALEPDMRVLVFALVVSLAAGAAAGLAPAWRASGVDLNTAMKSDPGGRASHAGGLRGALVGVQVGACMVLLVAAGLLLRGLQSTHRIEPGFPYASVALVTGDLRDLGFVGDALEPVQARLADAVRALPGIEAAGYSVDPPWAGRALTQAVRTPEHAGAAYTRARRNNVSADYFAAVGIPIVRGRGFAPGELAENSASVVVTEATARNFWPGRDPIGQTLLARSGDGADRALVVVGVARDAELSRIGEIDESYLYLPPQGDYRHMLSLVVRGRRDAAAFAPELSALLRRLDLALNVEPLEANLAVPRAQSAVLSVLATAIGVLTLALAAVGIFGVVSCVVSGRRREIGIRLALGATRRQVERVILRRALRPVLAGAALGGGGAVAASGLLSSMLFGVSPVDPLGLGGALLFVLAVAFIASLLPVRRGLRADPMTSLRAE